MDDRESPRTVSTTEWEIKNEHLFLVDKVLRLHIVTCASAGMARPRVPHLVTAHFPPSDLNVTDVIAALPRATALAVRPDGSMITYIAVADARCETVGDAVDLVGELLRAGSLPAATIQVRPLRSASEISQCVRMMERRHAEVGLDSIRPAGLKE